MKIEKNYSHPPNLEIRHFYQKANYNRHLPEKSGILHIHKYKQSIKEII